MGKKIITIWMNISPVKACYDLECQSRRPNNAPTMHCDHSLCEYRIQEFDNQCYNYECSKHPRNNGNQYLNECQVKNCDKRMDALVEDLDELRKKAVTKCNAQNTANGRED
jgi:hypothetical protein